MASCFVGVVLCCYCKLEIVDTFSIPQLSICTTTIPGLDGIKNFALSESALGSIALENLHIL